METFFFFFLIFSSVFCISSLQHTPATLHPDPTPRMPSDEEWHVLWQLLIQIGLRDRRSQVFGLKLHPCPLVNEIPPDSLNCVLILHSGDGGTNKCFTIFMLWTLKHFVFITKICYKNVHKIQHQSKSYISILLIIFFYYNAALFYGKHTLYMIYFKYI